jgi:hypothetical protein
MSTTIAHIAETTTVEVCVSFFLPTDARHWIPNGVATVNLTVPLDWMDCEQGEWEDLLTESAEAWCEANHGKGSFWGVIWEE